MARSIEIDAQSPTAQKDITLYRGERLEIRPRAPLGHARLIFAVSATPGGDPVLQVAGGQAVIVTRARLAALAEGQGYSYNLWRARGDDLTLLSHGSFVQRAAIEPEPAQAPVNLALPVIEGRAEVGARLSLDTGAWDGAESLAPEWRRDGVAVAGATGTGFDLGAEDAGRWIEARVTATGPGGGTTLPAQGGGPVLWPAPVAHGLAPVLAQAGQAIDLDLAAGFAGAALRFSLDPDGAPLPQGLSLSGAGRLSGVVAAPAAARLCGIIAANSGGSARADLALEIETARPMAFTARGTTPRLIVIGGDEMAARPGLRDMVAAGLGDRCAFPTGWMQAAPGRSAADVLAALPEALDLVRPGETIVLMGPLGALRAPGSESFEEISGQIAGIHDALLEAGAAVVAIPTLPQESGAGLDALNDALAGLTRDRAASRPDLHAVGIGRRETEGPHAGGFDPAVSFDPYTMRDGPLAPDLLRGAPFLAQAVREVIRPMVSGGLMPAVATPENRLGAAWDLQGAVPVEEGTGLSGERPSDWQVARRSGSGAWQLGRDAAGHLTVSIADSPDAGIFEIAHAVADLGGVAGDGFDLIAEMEIAPGATGYAGAGVALDGIASGPLPFGAAAGAPEGRLFLRSEAAPLAAPLGETTARITLGVAAGGSLSATIRRATLERRQAGAAPLAISGTPEAQARKDESYGFAPQVTGGTPPFAFDLAAGALPPGLALDPATGAISGIPEAAGDHAGIVLRVTDAAGASAALAPFAISVTAPLAAPPNLFTAAQSGFDGTAHLDGRGNWEIDGAGRLACTGAAPGNDARLSLDAPLVAGRSYLARVSHAPLAGTLKLQLGGDGSVSGRSLSEDWQDMEYFPEDAVAGNYLRLQAKPSTDYAGDLDAVALHDLTTVDPRHVACDVIIIGGDSNASAATSEPVSAANRETAFDPRIWTMPCLRGGGAHAPSQSERHRPMPMIEPVIGAAAAQRMSPCHAVASRLVARAAARGRPLLVMALGEAGSGLMNTEDWRRGSTVPGTGARMWDEMVAMKAALEALGPSHEIVGAVFSLGANDTFGGDYAVADGWLDRMAGFVADLRAEIADVPVVLWRVGRHYEPDIGGGATDGRGQAMGAAQERLDRDSGDARAISRLRVVTPPEGHQLSDQHDPHYTAAGMQAKGRAAGDALAALLEG